ncbi:MAG: G5 domain-containing protein [Ruminiclostridium sp.]|nr:G5 domain-containing protein [Ruminiclostridium sp.]
MNKRMREIKEKITREMKKYRFIRGGQITLSLTLVFVMMAEMFFTSMKPAESVAVYVTADGTTTAVEVQNEMTVSEILADLEIIMGEHDEISADPDSVATDGMNIVIDRVEYIDFSVSEPIAYETVYEESTLHTIGTEFVSREGENGTRVTNYTEKLVNGVPAERITAGVMEYPPVDEVITVGSATSEPYSKRLGDFELDGGIPTEYAYVVSGKVTAYTAPPGAGTYSGRKLEVGTVAVNPDIIPFGSELYICSKDGKHVYGYAVAADTGDLTEVVADVFMGLTSEHYGDACQWGAKFCDVYVLTVGDNSVSWMT